MARLIVGFDSAWSRRKAGAVVGALVDDHGDICTLGEPALASFHQATEIIGEWQLAHTPSSTLVLLEQPTIVTNDTGQRCVERIVCSAVGRRRGGMQPANTGRDDMFGAAAPLWTFLADIGGLTDPFAEPPSTQVIETYPVLAMIALGWTLSDSERPTGRLPKYNPERKTFATADWAHVCRTTAAHFAETGAPEMAGWAAAAASDPKPTKQDQDRLDAYICLLVALHLARGGDALFVGCPTNGYIVVPGSDSLRSELVARCLELRLDPAAWLRSFPLAAGGATVSGASASRSRVSRHRECKTQQAGARRVARGRQ
jgi:predicted RNase H-like nuclease